ncbi:class I SAM-dependent methyltransferase [Streptomyces sp. HNM0574]|nr:class I SAM-dependent methyltransferase [Streptomyces sp. HNM0574]
MDGACSGPEYSGFEAAYAGEALRQGLEGVPWNIGEPQPPVARLIEDGQVRGRVLDAGCGVGETSLRLAELGFDVLGVDSAPSAVRQAREAAAERKVPAHFELADVTRLSGYDGRFDTVIDSTLFHSLPVGSREEYLASIARAAAPGAVLHVLVFADTARFPGGEGPNAVTEGELREAVGRFWTVDRVVPSRITALIPEKLVPDGERDEHGRLLMDAFLLTAHLPGTPHPAS